MATPAQNGYESPMDIRAVGENEMEDLKKRVAAIETKIAAFEASLVGAAEMAIRNPAVSMMMPKDMKENLRNYLRSIGKDV